MRKKETKVLCVISNTCSKYIEDRRHQIRRVQKVIYKSYAETLKTGSKMYY